MDFAIFLCERYSVRRILVFLVVVVFLMDNCAAAENFGDEVVECLAKNRADPRSLSKYLIDKCEKLVEARRNSESTAKRKHIPWPVEKKRQYVVRCADDVTRQGMKDAQPFCSCVVDGMDREFGLERYSEMIASAPNQYGSELDKKLYAIFSSCMQR